MLIEPLVDSLTMSIPCVLVVYVLLHFTVVSRFFYYVRKKNDAAVQPLPTPDLTDNDKASLTPLTDNKF